jgi:pyrroline-5-carboxylate reductase
MDQLKVGLVGIGKLGAGMMTHWNKHHIKIGIYHPTRTKVEQFIEQFSNGYGLVESELKELDVLIVALPATSVVPFISNLFSEQNSPSSPLLINMATALHTKEIKAQFPALNIIGVKYMGHSRDLFEHGNGLFITENPLPKSVEDLYQYIGKIQIDTENVLTEVNKLATYLAIKAAIEIESEFTKKGFSPEYVRRALTSLAPEVIRGYSEGNLGHFAQEIVNEIKGEA